MSKNRYYDGPPSDHYDGTRFFLPGAAPPDKSRGDLLRFLLDSRFARWPSKVDDPPAPAPPTRVGGTGLRVTSIGTPPISSRRPA